MSVFRSMMMGAATGNVILYDGAIAESAINIDRLLRTGDTVTVELSIISDISYTLATRYFFTLNVGKTSLYKTVQLSEYFSKVYGDYICFKLYDDIIYAFKSSDFSTYSVPEAGNAVIKAGAVIKFTFTVVSGTELNFSLYANDNLLASDKTMTVAESRILSIIGMPNYIGNVKITIK